MQVKPFFRAFAVAVTLAALSVVASAQVAQLSGKVTLKQADGTEAPVPNAVVDIYRTDISGKWQVKTNNKGEYLHAGLPFIGTFTITVSAPNAQPTFTSKVRVSQNPVQNFTLNPGDGTRLTLDDIKKFEAGGGGAAASTGAAAGGRESAEDKAYKEELARRAKEIEEQKTKIASLNTLVTSGNEAFKAKKYDEAVRIFDQGIAAAPDEPVFYRNKAVVLRARAVDQYNAAKDPAARAAAREGLKASVENIEKAYQLFREHASKNPGTAPTPGSDELSHLADRQESYRLALMTNTAVDTQAAVKAFQEYIAVETDETKKMRAQSSLGESLFQSGQVDEAIAKFREVLAGSPNNLDAMYGLGIALAAKVEDATKDAAVLREARDLMQNFISKAPDTHPKKQDALASVQYIEDTMKSASAPRPSEERSRPARRRP
ncbi:MAG TPA: tetratricopeptide repeat protein [Pyrinomonadaceae bacterium]|nr:tetratricopeptide repeat protein [Pyrinomonadaceae bacterium]